MTTTPTTAVHEETANAMLVQLRELAQSVPGFAYTPRERRRRINAAASLRDDFLHAVAVACDASPQLATASQISGNELRHGISFAQAYRSVADELQLLAKGLRDTVAERRNDIGQRALRAYNIAKRMNRPEDREVLVPHLATMARMLNRGRKAATPADPQPAAPLAVK